MSFFNFGGSPNKSGSSNTNNEESGGFKMFGVGCRTSSFLGGGDSKFEGNFGDVGTLFGTGGFEAANQLEENSNDSRAFSFGIPATPAKKVRNDPPVQSSPASSSLAKQQQSGIFTKGAPPFTSPAVDVRKSQSATCSKDKESSNQPLVASQDYDAIQSRSSGCSPSVAKVSKEQKEQVEEAKRKESAEVDGLLGAEDLMKQLIDVQRQQLSDLLPELREREENSEQIVISASLVIKEMDNYGVKLSSIKNKYSNRLSQVSSFLRLIPKAEKQ